MLLNAAENIDSRVCAVEGYFHEGRGEPKIWKIYELEPYKFILCGDFLYFVSIFCLWSRGPVKTIRNISKENSRNLSIILSSE